MSKPIQSFALTLAGVYGVIRAVQMLPLLALPFFPPSDVEGFPVAWGIGALIAAVGLLVWSIQLVREHYATFIKEDFSKEILPVGIAVGGGLMVVAGMSDAIAYIPTLLAPNDMGVVSVALGVLPFTKHLFEILSKVLNVLIGVVFLLQAEMISVLIRRVSSRQ
jgi:hypothetical protein